MSNENFTLGFTVAPPALWNDFTEGYVGPATSVIIDQLALDTTGPAATIFGDLTGIDTTGPATTIFADLVARDVTGPAVTANTIGLCAANSILSLPGQSTLSGGPSNIMTCP